MSDLHEIQLSLTRALLSTSAVKFSPSAPFTWASGYRMPIYNDNRLLLGSYTHRALVCSGFLSLLSQHKLKPDVIAGTATAGIPHATTLADSLKSPLIYIRDKVKSHGMNNQIEGILQPQARAIVIEDVISTGESSLRAVNAVREAGGNVLACLAIYSYDFNHAVIAFKEGACPFYSILTYDKLIEIARSEQVISDSDFKALQLWREAPFQWGEKHGFPQVLCKQKNA